LLPKIDKEKLRELYKKEKPWTKVQKALIKEGKLEFKD
jgi:hypothetical protein